MVKMLSPKMRSNPLKACLLDALSFAVLFLGLGQAFARQVPKEAPDAPKAGTPTTTKAAASTPPKSATPDADTSAKSTAAKGDDAQAPASGDVSAADVPDPIQTRKDIQSEVFLDPRVADLLDVSKFKESKTGGARILSPVDLDTFKRMAGDPLATLDEALIRRVVDAQVVELSDHRNIQALLDSSENPFSRAATGIQRSTSLLLEAIFAARSGKNQRFTDLYNRILLQKLTPLLSNHLVPRVQAMIILGQSANREALKVFLDQIKNPEQTALVKLWAVNGILNIRKYSRASLSAVEEFNAAKVVVDLLETDQNLPWPVRYRALEVLGALRQGHSPAKPRNLEIATVAMRVLTDPKSKLEVRAEAARALGMMQISQVVTDYNYDAIAHTTAEIAAELGEKIGAVFSDNPGRSEYYASFLIGPILEAFEGSPGSRDTGLLRNATSPAQEKIQHLDNLIKPIAKSSIELIRATRGQVPAIQKELAAEVKTLKDYLQNNVPKDRRLIPGVSDPAPAERQK